MGPELRMASEKYKFGWNIESKSYPRSFFDFCRKNCAVALKNEDGFTRCNENW
jgi:hypothetical protein